MSKLFRHQCRYKICSIKKADLDISRECCCVKPVLPFSGVYTFAKIMFSCFTGVSANAKMFRFVTISY